MDLLDLHPKSRGHLTQVLSCYGGRRWYPPKFRSTCSRTAFGEGHQAPGAAAAGPAAGNGDDGDGECENDQGVPTVLDLDVEGYWDPDPLWACACGQAGRGCRESGRRAHLTGCRLFARSWKEALLALTARLQQGGGSGNGGGNDDEEAGGVRGGGGFGGGDEGGGTMEQRLAALEAKVVRYTQRQQHAQAAREAKARGGLDDASLDGSHWGEWGGDGGEWGGVGGECCRQRRRGPREPRGRVAVIVVGRPGHAHGEPGRLQGLCAKGSHQALQGAQACGSGDSDIDR